MEALTEKPKLLWVGRSPAPPNVCRAVADRWEIRPCRSGEPLAPQARAADLVLLNLDGDMDKPHRLGRLLDELTGLAALVVFMIPDEARLARQLVSRRSEPFLCVSDRIAADELAAKLSAAEQLRPVLAKLRADLVAARSLSDSASTTVASLNEEMRLAACLQRDFLPRRLPEVGAVRFGVLFRPTSWVSGDIYDIVRLDETHVGFYVADVVGHGMPAALLSMFIKKALQTKQIVGNSYQIIEPHVSLGELNADICEQGLSTCQFCTAVYCVLDTAGMHLSYARGGHPEPILFRADGSVQRLGGPGRLLGVFPEASYRSHGLTLVGGDRLILYTDGVEDVFRPPDRPGTVDMPAALGPLARLARDELLLQLTDRIDARYGGDNPPDDITMLVVDIER